MTRELLAEPLPIFACPVPLGVSFVVGELERMPKKPKLSRSMTAEQFDNGYWYVRLNKLEGSFPQAPSGRYINFLSNFLAAEKNATREHAVKAWGQLKKLDIPKDYRSWKKYRQQRSDNE